MTDSMKSIDENFDVSPYQIGKALEQRYPVPLPKVKEIFEDAKESEEALHALGEEGLLPSRDLYEYWLENWEYFEGEDWARGEDITITVPKSELKQALQEGEISDKLESAILDELLSADKKL